MRSTHPRVDRGCLDREQHGSERDPERVRLRSPPVHLVQYAHRQPAPEVAVRSPAAALVTEPGPSSTPRLSRARTFTDYIFNDRDRRAFAITEIRALINERVRYLFLFNNSDPPAASHASGLIPGPGAFSRLI